MAGMTTDVGTTPRRQLSPRQRLAVWERCEGRCHGPCGRLLRPGDVWQADHPRALGLGGPDDPTILVILCEWCFPAKNAADTRAIAKAKRGKIRHIGAKRPKSPVRGWRRFDGTPVRNPRL